MSINIVMLLGAVIAFCFGVYGLAKTSVVHTAVGVIVLAVTLFILSLGVIR